jgi:hypothetical protein
MLPCLIRILVILGTGKIKRNYFCFFAIQEPPASREQGRALHDRKSIGKPQILHARAKRKRSRAAVLPSKTEDNVACLHGTVNGGAEKRKDRELPEVLPGLIRILVS